jgi:hypothetical protein
MTNGGKRQGAGRKPGAAQLIRKATAEAILRKHDQHKAWARFLNSKDEKIALDAWKYMTDRRDGKAVQAIEHMGSVTVVVDL